MVNCNYALQVKGQLGYAFMGQKGSVKICSTSQWTVRRCSWVKKGQLGSIRSKLGSAAFMWGQEGSKEEKSGRLGEGFYERKVIWLGKGLGE